MVGSPSVEAAVPPGPAMCIGVHSVDRPSGTCWALAAGDGMNNVDDGSLADRRIEMLQVAHVFAVDKRTDEWPQLAGLMAEVEAHTGELLIERIDQLANSSAAHIGRPLPARPRAQLVRQVDGNDGTLNSAINHRRSP